MYLCGQMLPFLVAAMLLPATIQGGITSVSTDPVSLDPDETFLLHLTGSSLTSAAVLLSPVALGGSCSTGTPAAAAAFNTSTFVVNGTATGAVSSLPITLPLSGSWVVCSYIASAWTSVGSITVSSSGHSASSAEPDIIPQEGVSWNMLVLGVSLDSRDRWFVALADTLTTVSEACPTTDFTAGQSLTVTNSVGQVPLGDLAAGRYAFCFRAWGFPWQLLADVNVTAAGASGWLTSPAVVVGGGSFDILVSGAALSLGDMMGFIPINDTCSATVSCSGFTLPSSVSTFGASALWDNGTTVLFVNRTLREGVFTVCYRRAGSGAFVPLLGALVLGPNVTHSVIPSIAPVVANTSVPFSVCLSDYTPGVPSVGPGDLVWTGEGSCPPCPRAPGVEAVVAVGTSYCTTSKVIDTPGSQLSVCVLYAGTASSAWLRLPSNITSSMPFVEHFSVSTAVAGMLRVRFTGAGLSSRDFVSLRDTSLSNAACSYLSSAGITIYDPTNEVYPAAMEAGAGFTYTSHRDAFLVEGTYTACYLTSPGLGGDWVDLGTFTLTAPVDTSISYFYVNTIAPGLPLEIEFNGTALSQYDRVYLTPASAPACPAVRDITSGSLVSYAANGIFTGSSALKPRGSYSVCYLFAGRATWQLVDNTLSRDGIGVAIGDWPPTCLAVATYSRQLDQPLDNGFYFIALSANQVDFVTEPKRFYCDVIDGWTHVSPSGVPVSLNHLNTSYMKTVPGIGTGNSLEAADWTSVEFNESCTRVADFQYDISDADLASLRSLSSEAAQAMTFHCKASKSNFGCWTNEVRTGVVESAVNTQWLGQGSAILPPLVEFDECCLECCLSQPWWRQSELSMTSLDLPVKAVVACYYPAGEEVNVFVTPKFARFR